MTTYIRTVAGTAVAALLLFTSFSLLVRAEEPTPEPSGDEVTTLDSFTEFVSEVISNDDVSEQVSEESEVTAEPPLDTSDSLLVEVVTDPEPEAVQEEPVPEEESLPEVDQSIEGVSEPNVASAPELTTDKDDYHPGEVVSIFGSFFGVLKNVYLTISGFSFFNGDSEDTIVVQTDEVGSFTTDYQLEDVYRPDYTIEAFDVDGNKLAEHSFTDAANASVNIAQCDNGAIGATPVACDNPGNPNNHWGSGNVNGSKAHWQEGDFLPYRAVVVAPNTGVQRVTFSFDTAKSSESKHAIDYLGSYDVTETTGAPTATHANQIDPCGDVFTCNPAAPSASVAIPVPASLTTAYPGTCAAGTFAGSAQTGDLKAWVPAGLTISNLSIVQMAPATTGDCEAAFQIDFTLSGPGTVVFAWGGHVASNFDIGTGGYWGEGNAIPTGSPYHMHAGFAPQYSGALPPECGTSVPKNQCSFNVGSQDLQLASSAIVRTGTLIIHKDTVPDGPQDFGFTTTGGLSPSSFSLDDDADATLPNTQTYTSLVAGTYSVTEGANASYAVTIQCTDPSGGTTVNNGTRTASIDLAAGETVECTFTNTLQEGTLIVDKVTVPGGDATEFSILAAGTGAITGGGAGIVTDAQNKSYTVEPGTYSVTETVPAGWVETSNTCVDVVVAAGGEETCTITNTKQPRLTLLKDVVNDNGGTALDTAWTLTASGPTNTSGAEGSAAVTNKIVAPGQYTLGETGGPSGYASSTYSCVVNGGNPVAGNSLTLAAGDVAVCTITNNDIAPALHLRKVVVNDNGGTALASAWTLTANGAGSNDISGATPVDSGAGLKADTFALSESGPSGYSGSDWVCVGGTQNGASITLGLAEEATCTITNDDIPGKLKIVKNTEGGDDTFSFTVTGPSPSTPDITTVGGTGTTGEVTVDAGQYAVSETVPDGWMFDGAVCDNGTKDNFTVPLNTTVTCTFSNIKLGSISGKKFEDMNGDHVRTNGTTDPNIPGWTVRLDDADSTEAPHCESGTAVAAAVNGQYCEVQTDASGNYEFINLPPGNYIVSEVQQTGWTQTRPNATYGGLGAQANGTYELALSAGQTIDDRQFGNYEDPTLTVIKHVVNDNGGTAVAGSFTLTVQKASVDVAGSPAAGSESGVLYTLTPGDFVVGESTTTTGYTMTGISGDCAGNGAVTLQSGDEKTCTITNNDIAPALHLRKVVVNDNGGTALASAWTLTANGAGSNDISGATPVDSGAGLKADTFALSESGPSGYSGSDWVCVGGTQNGASITLGLAEEATCTITNDDIAPKLHLRKVVTNDNGGTATVADFTLSADGTNSNDLSGTSPVDSGSGLLADTFALSESGPAGYSASNWVCTGDGTQNGASITLGINEEATCTITNNDIAPKLTLNKVVVNSYNGNNVESDWTLTADGGSAGTLSGKGAVGDIDVVSGAGFKAGTYDLSELGDAGTDGYSASDWVCTGDGTQNGASISLALAEEAVCTITNTALPAKITLIKDVVNDNGGTALPDDFNLTVGGNGVLSGAANEVDANTPFALDETLLDGYDFVSIGDGVGDSAKCPDVLGGNVTLDEGEEVTCTIKNDDQPATLIITKDAAPNDLKDFTFSTNFSSNFLLDDDEGVQGIGEGGDIDQPQSKTFDDLSANMTYTVNETPMDYWELGSVSCVDTDTQQTVPATLSATGVSLELSLGQTVECTFHNNKLGPTRTQGFWQTHTAYTSQIFALTSMQQYVGFIGAATNATHKGTITNVLSSGASELFGAFYSNIAKKSVGKGKAAQRDATDKARMQLLQQLMAAKLNCAAFGCAQAIKDLIADADQAYKDGDKSAMNTLMGELDAYNNSGDTIIINATPGKATPKDSQMYADLKFWDNP